MLRFKQSRKRNGNAILIAVKQNLRHLSSAPILRVILLSTLVPGTNKKEPFRRAHLGICTVLNESFRPQKTFRP